MILFKNVNKKYGKKHVLQTLNLEIQGGEWVWLIGESGAGKSTLIHALIGDVQVDSGLISVDSYDITQFTQTALQEYRRKIGIVFQDYKLLSKMTVFENLEFAMDVCGYNQSEITKRIPVLLEKVGLSDAKNHFPYMLSGGEKQRVAIARALIHEPKLIIADEPTGNLDPKSADEIVELFRKLHINGTTVIFATHNPYLIEQMPSRIVQIKNGQAFDVQK